MEGSGKLANLKISEKELVFLVSYHKTFLSNNLVELVHGYLGKGYVEFLDIFAGSSFKFPSRDSLERDILAVKIFLFSMRRDFEVGSIKEASKMFGRQVSMVRKNILKVYGSIKEGMDFTEIQIENIEKIYGESRKDIRDTSAKETEVADKVCAAEMDKRMGNTVCFGSDCEETERVEETEKVEERGNDSDE